MNIIVSILALLVTPSLINAYPVFGTKRYHRANQGSAIQLNPIPMYTSVPQQYYDANYDPYVSSAAASYYPSAGGSGGGYNDDNNYLYYPRHEPQYHSYGLPTYRGEYKPTPYYYAQGPSYSYYDDRSEAANPLDDLHEEMLQEDERERQRDTMPVGQESWYENGQRQDSMANANAAFLRNLILYNKQLNAAGNDQQDGSDEFEDYNDFNNGGDLYEPQADSPYTYQNYDDIPRMDHINNFDDEEVRELKQLANNKNNQRINQYHQSYHQPIMPQAYQQQQQQHQQQQPQKPQKSIKDNNYQQNIASFSQYDADPEYDDDWINWDSKRNQPIKNDISIIAFSDRKPSNLLNQHPGEKSIITSSTIATPSNPTTVTTEHNKNHHVETSSTVSTKGHKGQKEVVLPRPATPVRHPFSEPVMKMLESQVNEKKRTADKPSVYDTIKHLLTMEQSLEKNAQEQQVRVQKRFVTNEEALVQELDGLKRLAA